MAGPYALLSSSAPRRPAWSWKTIRDMPVASSKRPSAKADPLRRHPAFDNSCCSLATSAPESPRRSTRATGDASAVGGGGFTAGEGVPVGTGARVGAGVAVGDRAAVGAETVGAGTGGEADRGAGVASVAGALVGTRPVVGVGPGA